MIRRCYYPSHAAYKNYGGRGIRVCDQWRRDPQAFLAWAKQTGYRHTGGSRNRLSLNRIDNNGDYSPENCTWSTDDEQAGNRTNNRWITIGGESKIAVDWGRDERCAVSKWTFYRRLRQG
jgi:hypothetical protein